MTRNVLLLLALGSIGCSEYGMVPDSPVDLGTGPEDWTDPSSQPDGTPPSEDSGDGPDGGEFIGRRPDGQNGGGVVPPEDDEDPEAGADDPEGDPEGDVPAEDPEGDPEGDVPAEDPEGDPEGDLPGEDPELDPDLDPDAGNGCTPGYWKQEQHLASWTAPFTTDTLFVDAFAVDAFPGLTLLEVLDLGDGDLDSLGRHAVAALLNSLDSDVDYPLTDLEVVDAFTSAYVAGVYDATKVLFELANEDHCPLN